MRRAVALALALGLAACGERAAGDPADAASSCQGLDFDFDEANCGACGKACGADEACARGACYPEDCPGDPCEEGSVCYSGVCVPERCVGVVCAAGTECRQGACVCTGNEGCPGGRVCKDGACVACVDGDDDALCGLGKVCFGGACVTDPCWGVVCPEGIACFQGSCQAECAAARDCSGGRVCRAGACVPCAGPSDDGRCGTGKICVAGVCIRGDCRTRGDCAGGLVCKDHLCGPCVDGADDALCGAGEACVGGACAAPADAGMPPDAGAPAGCDAGSGWCEGAGGCIAAGRCCTSADCTAAAPTCTGPGGQCVSFAWSAGAWGSCSNGCGDGTQSRAVTCKDSTGAVVAEALCPQPKPDTEQGCSGSNCGPFCTVLSHPTGHGDCPEGPVSVTFPQIGCSCAAYDAAGNGSDCGLGYFSWGLTCADGSAVTNYSVDPGSCWCYILNP